MRSTHAFAGLLLLLAAPFSIFAADEDGGGRGWALDVKAGTLGIGADLSRSIIPRLLNLRIGAGFYSYTTEYTDDGIDYTAKLKLGAVPVVVDVFPFRNWFRLGAGVAINLTEADGTGKTATGSFRIGDHEYTSESIGRLTAKLKANRAAPYVGMGFNNPIKRSGRLGFFADLGILCHGHPRAEVTTTRTVSQLQSDIEKEAQEIGQDIRKYTLFPVVQLGFSYRF